jgi:toxin HigB-1
MIKSFKHKGLEKFFLGGSSKGIQASHAERLRIQLSALDAAAKPDDLRAPLSWRLHALKGDLRGYWSLTVNGHWRVIFRFDGKDVELVDYLDYH